MATYIVELHSGVWLKPCIGDSMGRTLVKDSAKQYKSKGAAGAALKRAREHRPFLKAQILTIEARTND